MSSDEQHRGDEEEGEHEPGDAGGTRGLEPALGLEHQAFLLPNCPSMQILQWD
jgi:hypothetical protein